MHEQIDDLRALLGVEDRSGISMVMLQGVRETTGSRERAMARTFEPSGDIAYVFMGPREKLQGVRRQAADGTITFAITLPSEDGEVGVAPERIASFGIRNGFIEVVTENGVRVRLDAKTVKEMYGICEVFPERLDG